MRQVERYNTVSVTGICRHSGMDFFPAPLQRDRGFTVGSSYPDNVAFSVTT